MASEVKFNIFLRLVTDENIIFMSKNVLNILPIQFSLLRIAFGAIYDKVSKISIILTVIFVWTCLKVKV